tara:strand:+ start:217 stop:468 length:252 start_codon:yes stop_codon:yes gene_type:complete
MMRFTDYSLLFLLLVSTSCVWDNSNIETNRDIPIHDKEKIEVLPSEYEDKVRNFSLETNDGILSHQDIFSNDKPVLLFFGASY